MGTEVFFSPFDGGGEVYIQNPTLTLYLCLGFRDIWSSIMCQIFQTQPLIVFIKETSYLIPCAIESCLSTMVFKGLIRLFHKDPSPLVI